LAGLNDQASGSRTPAAPPGFSSPGLLDRIEERIIGLRRPTEVLVTALRTGRHVILEGPPGVGKSTLLRVAADAAGWGMEFVEGNAELTPARLVGAHDPALVLERGYLPEAFTEGPLVAAMRGGSLLYIEELNRVPEETLNVLITALAEGEIHVPRVGHIAASPQFRLIAAMNPFDAVGTARVGQAIYDRMCRIALGYQDRAGEERIVEQVTGEAGEFTEVAVALGRATREHEALRTGSSVRGAIDMVFLARGLQDLRGSAGFDSLLDAALAAFSGRVRVEEGRTETPEEIITALLERIVEERRPKKASDPAPTPEQQRSTAGLPRQPKALEGQEARDAIREASRRTTSRTELTQRYPELLQVSPEVGRLDEAAFEELMGRDSQTALAMLCDLAVATDARLRARARQVAARVFVRMARQGRPARRGLRRMATVRGAEGDIELDRTLDRTGGMRPRRPEDFVVRRWAAAERAICLLVDRSGSMKGEAVAMAALAAAAVVIAGGEQSDCSVVAFSDRPIVLQSQGQRRPPGDVVGELLTLRGLGTTDLASALAAAASQLQRATSPDRLTVLMSDCLATAGTDPVASFPGIDRLHVLGTSLDADSVAAGRALARRGGGRHVVVLNPDEVAQALSSLLA
jgi:MoxR-like ATPase